MRFDAVVLSDLHLGARNCRAEDVLRFLDWVDAERIVLNGDIFDDPMLRGLERSHLAVLERLRELSAERSVEWLRGNHDPEPEWWETVLRLPCHEETELAVGDKRYLVFHGHRWDRSLDWPHWLVNGADEIYRFSQRVDPTHRLARFLKHRCKHFCRAVDRLQRMATVEARRRLYDGVVVGHTHVAADLWQGSTHFLNSGCWTEKPAAFVGVRDGRAKRYFWEAVWRRSRIRRAACAAPTIYEPLAAAVATA